MNKQFIELIDCYYNSIHQYAMNKHVIQLSLTFVSLFMHLPIYFYVLYYTFVHGTC